MKRLVLLGLAISGVAACGDNSGDDDSPIDARVIDGVEVDADDTDAPPAAVISGTISLLEAQLLDPGTAGTFFGQGVQVGISFTSNADVPGPVMEEQVGSPFGCKAWEYTAAQAAAASLGLDEGSIQITGTAGTTPPELPPCIFQAGAGYICPHAATQSTGGIIAAGPSGTATLTDLDTTFDTANSTNRYVSISGATTAANNGVFPIIAVAGANTIIYGNPAFAAETIPATGGHINLAGVGPTPDKEDPGFLEDDVAVSFALTAGGGMDFDAFTVSTGVGTVGNDFTLATEEAIKLNAIPSDGNAFTVTCDATGCPAGSASGTILNIVTTDTATTGLSDFAMPLPTTKRVQVRCALLNQTAITIPAAYSALLMSSGATRIQATFIRPTLMASDPVTAISGHAIVGYTNP